MDRAFKARLEARFADQLTGPVRQRHDETEIRIGPGDVILRINNVDVTSVKVFNETVAKLDAKIKDMSGDAKGKADPDFRTKPQLALEMLESALEAGVPARWVVGDEVSGSDGKLRRALEARGQAYVLAVRSNEKPSTWPPYGALGQAAVADLAATIPAEGWQRHSCGEGIQGPRSI